MSQPAFVYDPRGHTFESWSALMCEAYAAQQLLIGTPEAQWQSWGAGLKGIDIFQNEAVPDPYSYNDWRAWAEALVNNVNPRN